MQWPRRELKAWGKLAAGSRSLWTSHALTPAATCTTCAASCVTREHQTRGGRHRDTHGLGKPASSSPIDSVPVFRFHILNQSNHITSLFPVQAWPTPTVR